MDNRLWNKTQTKPTHPGHASERGSGPSATTQTMLSRSMQKLEHCVAEHPLLALGTACFSGVVIGCLIKR